MLFVGTWLVTATTREFLAQRRSPSFGSTADLDKLRVATVNRLATASGDSKSAEAVVVKLTALLSERDHTIGVLEAEIARLRGVVPHVTKGVGKAEQFKLGADKAAYVRHLAVVAATDPDPAARLSAANVLKEEVSRAS